MRKLEALKIEGVQRKKKKKTKNMFYELESFFLFLLFFHYSSFALRG
jgi:hypothetical protein